MVIHRKSNAATVTLTPQHELDRALELLHFGFRGLTVEADIYLADLGLSRVHHRVLYVIARAQNITVGLLADTLGISKQALHRPLTQLQEQGLVLHARDPQRHRFKQLTLTERGIEVEHQASSREREAVGTALDQVSEQGRDAWYAVMQSLADRLL